MIRRIKEKLTLQYDSTTSFFADALTRMRAHEGFKRYFKNTGWLFAGKMFGLVMSFFIGAYVARYLGPERYGLMSYVVSFVGLFAFLSNVGVDNILSRELITYPSRKNELLGTSFCIKIFGSLLAIAAICLASFFINSNPFTNLLTILFSITFIFQSFGVIDLYFQSQVLSKKTVKAQVVATIISASLKMMFIAFHLGVGWFIGAYVIDSILLAIGLVIIFKSNKFSLLSWRFNRGLFTEMLKDSWPLMLAGASVAIYSRIDQVMIGHYINNEAVGLYSIAAKLSEVWYFVPMIIVSSLFPAIVNAKSVSRELYEKRLKHLYRLMIILSVGIALPAAMFANFIIRAIFGVAYLGAVGILQIYVWSGVSVFLGVAIGQYLIAENFTKINFSMTFLGMISNVLLNIVLIPRYGVIGAASATLISYSLATFSVLFFKKSRPQGLVMVKAFISG